MGGLRPGHSVRYIGLAALGVCGTVLATSALLPAGGLGIPSCLFRLVTRLPCPSCGMTRAFIAISDGRVEDAFLLNAASPLVYAAVAAILLAGVAQFATGVDMLRPTWTRTRRGVIPLTIAALTVAWAANLFGGL